MSSFTIGLAIIGGLLLALLVLPLTVPVLCTCCTPLIRPIMPGAVLGSSAVAPVRLCPSLAVSRLVPS